jgi:hypothetical protein
MNAGVPQGSILGPLLFSIYVADMNHCVKFAKLQQYADDSQLFISFNAVTKDNSKEQLNSDLQNIQQFANEHNLKLNASKSSVIFFNKKKNI